MSLDALYAAIADTPDDPAPYLVVADALECAGDPRGQLVLAQHRLESDPDDSVMRRTIDRLFRKHPELIPSAVLLTRFGSDQDHIHRTWRWGFVRRLWLYLPNDHIVQIEVGVARHEWTFGSARSIFRELADHPSCRFLQEVVLVSSVELDAEALLPFTERGIPVHRSVPVSDDPDEIPLARALEQPATFQMAQVDEEGLQAMLQHASQWTALEVLSVYTRASALPAAITELPALRTLDLGGCGSLTELPETLFARRSLQRVTLYRCVGLRQAGYDPTRTHALLEGFRRAHTPPDQRRLETLLSIGAVQRAQASGTCQHFVRALESNIAQVRTHALLCLEAALQPVTLSGTAVLAGRFGLGGPEIRRRLAASQITVKRKAEDCWFVAGQRPGPGALQALDTGRLALERDVVALSNDPVSPAPPAEDLAADLRSGDTERIRTALATVAAGPGTPAQLAEVLAVSHDVGLSAPIRKRAKGVFTTHAGPALGMAIRTHFRQSPMQSGPAKRETRIRAVEAAAPGFDALSYALALAARNTHTWSLLFERVPNAQLRTLLQEDVQEGTLEFSGQGIQDLPAVLEAIDFHTLLLGYLGLTTLPRVVSRLTQLRSLDVSENQLETLPDLSALVRLEHLDAWGNRFTKFPSALRGLGLVHLDLSALDTGVRIRELPDWLGSLTKLRSLALRSHAPAQLPDGLFTLSQLESLDLTCAKLPPPDARLAQLTRLQSLHIRSSSWEEHAEKLARWLPACTLDPQQASR